MKNKVIILGCGSSTGVPLIGPFWGKCDPSNLKNRRLRSSIYVEYCNKRFLIDTAVDLRQQLLAHNISDCDAILLTHHHADHTHGLNDLRPMLKQRQNSPFPLYGDATTIAIIKQSFEYLFHQTKLGTHFSTVKAQIMSSNIIIDDVTIQSFAQQHGNITSYGFRFGSFAYSTDFNHLNSEALIALKGVETWVIDCLSYSTSSAHNNLDSALNWIRLVKPRSAILTHMGHELDYDSLLSQLPNGVKPAYDGLEIEFK